MFTRGHIGVTGRAGPAGRKVDGGAFLTLKSGRDAIELAGDAEQEAVPPVLAGVLHGTPERECPDGRT